MKTKVFCCCYFSTPRCTISMLRISCIDRLNNFNYFHLGYFLFTTRKPFHRNAAATIDLDGIYYFVFSSPRFLWSPSCGKRPFQLLKLFSSATRLQNGLFKNLRENFLVGGLYFDRKVFFLNFFLVLIFYPYLILEITNNTRLDPWTKNNNLINIGQ